MNNERERGGGSRHLSWKKQRRRIWEVWVFGEKGRKFILYGKTKKNGNK